MCAQGDEVVIECSSGLMEAVTVMTVEKVVVGEGAWRQP